MAITGLFSRNRPKIGDLYFDALLEESSELRTDVSEFPLEDASTAQDNAVTRSLALTMTIAVSVLCRLILYLSGLLLKITLAQHSRMALASRCVITGKRIYRL